MTTTEDSMRDYYTMWCFFGGAADDPLSILIMCSLYSTYKLNIKKQKV